ncbi:UDP-N-acetylmuramoyl-L-alanine--D-glutamate ligase, partial [Candidatus Woesebacteria bacterium]|nr:UDP-N-acetylmuramoyl-L-alanine--D-glutamate ligase [Candidatus Woesebacteria bacterium]
MHYSDWKVAILGFGVEGKDAARYFLGQKSIITVFDKKEEKELLDGKWKNTPITFKTGEDYLKNGIRGFDLVVRSPGFYRFMAEIVDAGRKGAKITSNTNLFFEESEANIIAVTGTKGKGTTAKMLELGLKAAGKSALVLGNIGEPMLDHIEDADTFDWVILELSSFQTIDLKLSPKIAIVTNITVEHLNWHKDREEYVAAKENLWRMQTKDDFVVFNADDETSRELSKTALGQVVWFSTQRKVQGAYFDGNKVVVNFGGKVHVGTKDLRVPGEHMLSDALAALVGAVVARADPKLAWKGIADYKGAPHRMEEITTIDGVLFINDSFATTP